MAYGLPIWAIHPDSQKIFTRAVALLAIQDCVLAETSDVDSLIAASEEGKSRNLHTNWFSDDMQSLPGVYHQIGLSFCTFRSQFFFAFLHNSVSKKVEKTQCIIRSQIKTTNQKCIIRSQFQTKNQQCIIRSQPELNKKNINLFPSGAVFSSNLFPTGAHSYNCQFKIELARNKAARPRTFTTSTEYKPRSAIVCLPA